MNHDEFLSRVLNAEEMQALNGRPVMVALSGGADSVALLRVLLEAGCTCHAAHCNFHLRDSESMRDEEFVRELCLRLNIPLTVKDFDVPAWQLEHGGSVEMACREMRYHWFEQERNRLNCAYIAVAHHADDQVETLFLNLTRGTGVRGLTGMDRMSHRIWRPLLSFTRNDIIDYLKSIGQDFVTDSTNAQNDYRRNRLRNIVLPTMEQQFPKSRERILHTMDNLRRDRDLLDSLIKDILPDDHHISTAILLSCPQAPTLLYHRIRHMGFNREQCVQAVEAAQQGHTGRLFPANGQQLVVNRFSLDITPTDTDQDIEIPIDLHSGLNSPVHIDIIHGGTPFTPRMCDGKYRVAFNTQLADCQRTVLRHWRRGDRIKPFGMNGTKLVSDLFADLKLDYADKQNAWIMEADGQIIWVLGYRASAIYPVKPEAQEYLLLTLDKK